MKKSWGEALRKNKALVGALILIFGFVMITGFGISRLAKEKNENQVKEITENASQVLVTGQKYSLAKSDDKEHDSEKSLDDREKDEKAENHEEESSLETNSQEKVEEEKHVEMQVNPPSQPPEQEAVNFESTQNGEVNNTQNNEQIDEVESENNEENENNSDENVSDANDLGNSGNNENTNTDSVNNESQDDTGSNTGASVGGDSNGSNIGEGSGSGNGSGAGTGNSGQGDGTDGQGTGEGSGQGNGSGSGIDSSNGSESGPSNGNDSNHHDDESGGHDTGTDEQDKTPKITCSLVDGKFYKRNKLNFPFYFAGWDYRGNYIDRTYLQNYSVTINGAEAQMISENDKKRVKCTSTTALKPEDLFELGTNTVKISVTDEEGNHAERTIVIEIDIRADIPDENDITVSVTIDRSSIGLGSLASGTVKVPEGSSAETALKVFCDLHRIRYSQGINGTDDSGFYLARIMYPGITKGSKVSVDAVKKILKTTNMPSSNADAIAFIEEYGLNDNSYQDSLGEFDFQASGWKSGWVYLVNGGQQNYGMSKYMVKEGDNLRICFTLNLGIEFGMWIPH